MIAHLEHGGIGAAGFRRERSGLGGNALAFGTMGFDIGRKERRKNGEAGERGTETTCQGQTHLVPPFLGFGTFASTNAKGRSSLMRRTK